MTLIQSYLHARQSLKNVQALSLWAVFVCCFVSCHSRATARPKARPKGVLAYHIEKQKYIFSLFIREFSCSAYLSPFSFFFQNSKAMCESDLAGKESRKRDRVANMIDVEIY